MTKIINKGDVLYWSRIVPETGIYEVNELKIRTIEDKYFVGVDKKSRQAFLFSHSALDNIIFSDREDALRQVIDAEKNKKDFTEIYYEED